MNRAFIAPLVVFSLGIASCGGDEGKGDAASTTSATTQTTTTQTTAPTKKEYIAKADALCTEYNEKFKPLEGRAEALSKDKTADEALSAVTPILEDGLKIRREGTEEIAALGAPPGEEQQVQKFINLLRDSNGMYTRLVDAADRGDAESYTSVSEELDRHQEKQRAFEDGYGFQECGKD